MSDRSWFFAEEGKQQGQVPIPWALRSYATWYASRFGLVERGVGATA
jgi:hypothetical protein